MPLDTVGVQWQTQKEGLSVGEIVQKCLKEKGMAGFYKGYQAYSALAFKVGRGGGATKGECVTKGECHEKGVSRKALAFRR
jgi:hypothetical protein